MTVSEFPHFAIVTSKVTLPFETRGSLEKPTKELLLA